MSNANSQSSTDSVPWFSKANTGLEILVITNLYPTAQRPSYGTFVKVSTENLRHIGCNVPVISVTDGGRGALGYLKFYWRAFKAARKSNGLVYVHYVSHSAPPVILASFFNSKMKLALHYHGSDAFPELGEGPLRRLLKDRICRFANSRADLVIAPSRPFGEQLRRKFGLRAADILESASGGVNTSVFAPSQASNRPIDVAFVGRMIAGKGAIAAATIIRDLVQTGKAACGLMLGDGPERQSVEAALLPVSGSVQLRGSASQVELARVFQRTKILLFPSNRSGESLGLTWIEAAICGVVPVLSRSDVVIGILPASISPYLVGESSQDLMTKAAYLLDHPELCAEIRRTLVPSFAGDFNSESVARKLAKRLKLICDPRIEVR